MIENNENFENQLTNEELIEIAQTAIKNQKISIAISTPTALVSAALAISGFVMGNYQIGGLNSVFFALNTGITISSANKIKELKNLIKSLKETEGDKLFGNNEAEMQDKDVFPDIYSDKKEQSI